MLKKKGRFGRRLLYVFLVIAGLLLLGFVWLAIIARVEPPHPADTSSLQLQRTEPSAGLYTIKNNWFRKSKSGLYELYVEGSPFERGVINGKLTEELVQRQEDHFNEQITKMVPSNFYRHFLKYFIGWFNRHLADNVTEEYKEEIYGVSYAASSRYDYIGTNYQRILNYHAAHDIGHALQTMALVGCTSFGTWGAASDSNMIIGRNFDFYVGDKFAEDKIVAFFHPSAGHRYMTVTWGGFVGAVSGMNDQGLTVTINADKTSLPSASATPVSLVAREILQYAGTTAEAIAIARKRTMFVSESFLIGSARDNKAIVIEKTPDTLDIYDPQKRFIVCANHFQGKELAGSAPNLQQLRESASDYRYKRVMELIDTNGTNTLQKTVAVLRDRRGLHNADIGMGNEKAINQLIAHHSIVFEPKKLLVWVSASPWQLGEYVAYDLNKVFALSGMKENREIADSALTLPADSFLQTQGYKDFTRFRQFKQRLADGGQVDPDSLVNSNPSYYHAWVLAGDYLYKQKKFAAALPYYQTALTKVIATKAEEDHIRKRIADCSKKIKS
ncbi:MAG TPA: C45 family peptidase [Chitinophagaceae bacterium]|nr:C45 family peptidase [Chitinophagaceae bacterium]